MKFRSTLILAGVLFALCAGYVAMQYRGYRSVVRELEAKRLFDFEGQQVQSLEIDRLEEAVSAAERDETGQWRITEPDPAIVPFQYIWERMAANLSKIRSERGLDSGGDLSQYGLDPPVLTVKAKTDAAPPNDTIEMQFGELTPTQNMRYALLNGERLLLVAKESFFELDRPLEQLRSRFLVDDRDSPLLSMEFVRIFTGSQEGESQVEIGDESVPVKVVRRSPEDSWRLVSPVEAVADQDKIKALADALQFAVGWGHVDAPEALGDYGLDPASARLKFTDAKDRVEQTVLFGHVDSTGESSGVFVKRADHPAVFLIDGHIIGQFPTRPDAFRDARLLTHQAGEIESVQYDGPRGSFALAKEPTGAWRMDPEDLYGTDQRVASSFFAYLKSLTGEQFPAGKPEDFGLDAPLIRIAMHFSDREEPAEIRLSPYNADAEYYVATQDVGAVTLLPRKEAEALLFDRLHFRSRELLRFDKAAAVAIECGFEGTDYRMAFQHGQWIVTAPEGLRLANQSDATDLLDACSPLFAASIIADEPAGGPAAFGLDEPLLSLAFMVRDEEGAEEVRHGPLLVGRVTEERSDLRYASAASLPGFYRVEQELVDTVRNALRGVVRQ